MAKIDQIQINDAEGKPAKGGINDPKLGTVDKGSICETCGSNFTDCVGHFGHIELAKPVFHLGNIEEIKKIIGVFALIVRSCFCLKGLSTKRL